jgi:hypothetical protein
VTNLFIFILKNGEKNTKDHKIFLFFHFLKKLHQFAKICRRKKKETLVGMGEFCGNG